MQSRLMLLDDGIIREIYSYIYAETINYIKRKLNLARHVHLLQLKTIYRSDTLYPTWNWTGIREVRDNYWLSGWGTLACTLRLPSEADFLSDLTEN